VNNNRKISTVKQLDVFIEREDGEKEKRKKKVSHHS
jgi:hypothetical protein